MNIKIMNILSLFDGMSCGQIALNKLGIKYDKYFASEIDKYAIQVTQNNYPNTVHIGDIRDFKYETINDVDLLLGGSPCQDLSLGNTNNRKGLEGDKSKLFFDYANALKYYKPKYFIYENVSNMTNKDRDIISKVLECEPYKINSKYFSCQDRSRYYWTNINFDSNFLDNKDFIINNETISSFLDANFSDNINDKYINDYVDEKSNKRRLGYVKNLNRGNRVYSPYHKSITLTANSGGIGRNCGLFLINNKIRRLSPTECEKLQEVPYNYTLCENVPNTQRYKMLGNGWTITVIEHILKGINNI